MRSDDRRVWRIIMAAVALLVLFIPASAVIFEVNYDYTLRTVALGGAVLGLLSGTLGCFAVLRNQSLLGDALSHAALPGVAVAFLLAGRELSILLLGAGISSWLGTLFISSLTRTTPIKQDTAMGIVLAAWFAFGIALLAYIQGRPDASQAGLDKFILGQAAAIVQKDVQLVSAIGLGVLIVLGLLWKEFKLITFDPEFAGANGMRVGLLDTVLLTLIVIAIILGLQLAGVILMVGLLIAPAIAARQWTHNLEQMVILSAVFGGFAGTAGAIISAIDVGVPTGPLIIVVAFVLAMLSIGFAPERGVVWSWQLRRREQLRLAERNVLYDLYRHGMGHEDVFYPTEEKLLVGIRGPGARSILAKLAKQGAVTRLHNHSWSLTPEGARLIEELVLQQPLDQPQLTHDSRLANSARLLTQGAASDSPTRAGSQ